MRWQRNTCAKGKESGGEVTQRLGSLLALRDSPLSISAPPETRTVRPTRSRGDADETVLCLQPDLPLAKKLCPADMYESSLVQRYSTEIGRQMRRPVCFPLIVEGAVAAAAAPVRRTNQLLLPYRSCWEYVGKQPASKPERVVKHRNSGGRSQNKSFSGGPGNSNLSKIIIQSSKLSINPPSNCIVYRY